MPLFNPYIMIDWSGGSRRRFEFASKITRSPLSHEAMGLFGAPIGRLLTPILASSA
jgi:hypothetical protein